MVISIAELTQAGPDFKEDNDDLLAPKPIWKRAIYPPRPGVNGVLVGCFLATAIVLSVFWTVSLPSPFNGWSTSPHNIVYTVQLPLMLMTAALLGPFMGPAVLLFYLLAGLIAFPLFANGGGWTYVFEPGFGYLLGTFLVGFRLSRTFHKALQKTERQSCSLKLIKKAFLAVVGIHAIGIAYLLGLSVFGLLSWADLGGWLTYLSLEKAPYDLLFTLTLLALVRQIRLMLWPVLY